MHKFIMTIKKTIPGKNGAAAKREELGKVEAFAPEMSEILKVASGAEIAQATDDSGKLLFAADGKTPLPASDEDGFPIYTTAEANWLMGAVISQAQAKIRSLLVKDSIELKEGKTIPATFAELAAAGNRDGSQALANMRDCRAAFALWISQQGKSSATVEMANTLFKNRDALTMQSEKIKTSMQGYVENFSLALAENAPDELERFTKTIDNVLDACKKPEVAVAVDF